MCERREEGYKIPAQDDRINGLNYDRVLADLTVSHLWICLTPSLHSSSVAQLVGMGHGVDTRLTPAAFAGH